MTDQACIPAKVAPYTARTEPVPSNRVLKQSSDHREQQVEHLAKARPWLEPHCDHNFSQLTVHAPPLVVRNYPVSLTSPCARPVPIQTKLAVSRPDDIYEQEADRIAEAITRTADTPAFQRKCARCDNDDGEELQRKEAQAPGLAPDATSLVPAVLRSTGQTLDPTVRSLMDSRFGHDFSNVRVHIDSRAAESARAVQARAYTVGQNIVFGAGQYAPGTQAGNRLLAHELTHTLQQRDTPRPDQNLRLPAALTPRIQCEGENQASTAPPPAQAFSVNQATYLQLVNRAIQNLSGRFVGAQTLAGSVVPILQAMLARVTWRDAAGVDHGGGPIQYPLPGPPPLTLNLRLVLDDQPDTQDAGRFTHTGETDGVMEIRIRRNPDADELATTLYHEALHLVSWLINRPASALPQGAQPQAARSLTMSRFTSQIRSIRNLLDRLAQSVNSRRAAGQTISSAMLDSMAPWLMEEVQVRAETEVFRLAASVQQARASRGPAVFMGTMQNTEVNLSMVNRYVFDFSRVFQPGDRASLNTLDRDTLRLLAEILEGFFQWQVRRRFSLTAHTTRIPRAPFQYTPPPLQPPSSLPRIEEPLRNPPF